MTRYQEAVAAIVFLAALVHGQVIQTPVQQPSKKGCGIPIVVNTVPIPDVDAMAGRWYKHRHTAFNTWNQFLDHIPLNRTVLPYTTIPAQGLILRIEQYFNLNDTECVHRVYIGYYGSNGQMPGVGLSSVDKYVPAANYINMLYLDVDSFYLAYICRHPNYKTGMCDAPYFHFITRNRPDKMTAEQVKKMDEIADAVLAPYCYSVYDIPQQHYTDDKPFCDVTPFDECAEQAVNRFIQDISNSVTN